MMTFDDYKDKVSIIQVLEDLGYQQDISKGRVSPVFVKTQQGKKVDEVIIKNPNSSLNQHYFDRNYKGGDLIAFIKNHISEFPQFYHENQFVHINKILGHYANIPYVPKYQNYKASSQEIHFEANRYKQVPTKVDDLKYLTIERKISPNTVETFLPFIHRIQDTKANNNFINIGFPYTIPGQPNITNYEVRNFGFKGMTEGGDKSNSVWLANFAGDNNLVKSVFIAESALDAMSFYELNKSKVILGHSCFCSVGGYITNNQINNILKAFPNANIHTCFDNDLAGTLYNIRVNSAIQNTNIKIIDKRAEDKILFEPEGKKSFTIPKSEVSIERYKKESGDEFKCRIHKPVGNHKDFNEVLQQNKKISIKR
ncbi:toprim domain-containing protein [Capnocytophaga canis]|uniref:Uncharacterized protein n=1 Tax=Capnocytophaga canis TaxID=1848903 RepID=A0A0B7IS69_9FLAO|nr:toprim domain-containing protein [Capnocytophaga canis]CEN52808.1 conserved hypothetical protein [Capnocytophaga canis]